MAPNPDAKAVQPWALQQLKTLKGLAAPHLVTWAVHTNDVGSIARKLRDRGVAAADPVSGSRVRPDGRILKWRSLNLADNKHGLLPFFIEWSADSVHPSVDAPAGCSLERFSAADQSPAELSASLQKIEVSLTVETADRPQLRARLRGQKGELDVTS